MVHVQRGIGHVVMTALVAGPVMTAALAAATCTTAAQAQSPMQDVRITATDLGGGVHMLEGRGGNIAISVGEDGVVMVDDQFAPLTDKIQAKIAEITGTEGAVRFIINTHYHGDHTGGNEAWAGRGADVVAHDQVRQLMAFPPPRTLDGAPQQPKPPAALPVMTYSDAMTLHLNGETIRLVHVANAHTRGDSLVVFDGANVIHAGDTLFNGYFPYIDVNGGGSIDGLIAAQALIVEMADAQTQIVPGHGPLASRDDVAANLAVLRDIRDSIAGHIAAGDSLEQTLAANPLAKFDDPYGSFFIRTEQMTRIAYQSLAGGGVGE